MLQPLLPSGLGTYRFIKPGLVATKARPLSSLGNTSSFLKRSCIICCIWQTKCILCNLNEGSFSKYLEKGILICGNNMNCNVFVIVIVTLKCILEMWCVISGVVVHNKLLQMCKKFCKTDVNYIKSRECDCNC